MGYLYDSIWVYVNIKWNIYNGIWRMLNMICIETWQYVILCLLAFPTIFYIVAKICGES